jgi:hypothetical protein
VLKGALVAPETGAGGGEEGDIPGSANPHSLAALVPDLVIPDEPLNSFTANIAGAALARFVSEFDGLRHLYTEYKRQAALLDFDDLLHHARDLLASNPWVRRALSHRYPRILVDEFQDTDPLQAEILWLLCGEREMRASRGLLAGCGLAVCFWWETLSRRSTASAAPTSTPTS